MEIGRKHAKTGAGSQAFQFWNAFMKNEFGWTDKSELSDGSAKTLTNDEISDRIRQLKSKIAKLPSNAEMKSLLDGDV